MYRGQPEERLKGGHGDAPSVEAERELVEVDLEMGVTDAMMRADEPGLEVSEDPVDARQHLLGALGRSLGAGPVPVAQRAERGVALPGVGDDTRPGCDHAADEPGQGAARRIGHDLKPDAARGAAADLDSADHQHLVEQLAAAPQSNLRPADVGFVDLHVVLQGFAIRAHHGPAQLMEHHPGHLVAGNAELALQLERRQPGRMRGDEARGPEPEGQRCARTMQHRPPGDGGLMPTGLALPEPSPRELKRLGVLAAWTVVPLWPSTLGQVPTAGSLVAEPRLKVGQRPRKVRPSHTPTLPVGAFGVNRISMSVLLSQPALTHRLRPHLDTRVVRAPVLEARMGFVTGTAMSLLYDPRLPEVVADPYPVFH